MTPVVDRLAGVMVLAAVSGASTPLRPADTTAGTSWSKDTVLRGLAT